MRVFRAFVLSFVLGYFAPAVDAAQMKAAQQAEDEVNDGLADDGGGVEKAKATRKARTKPIDKIAEMHGKQMEAHGQTIEVLGKVAEALGKPKKRTITTPSGKTYTSEDA